MRKIPITFLATTCYTGTLLIGFENGFVSPTANSLIEFTPMTLTILPIFAGMIFSGTLIMLPILSFTSHTINTKCLLIVSTIPGCVGWFTAVTGSDVFSMLLGRCLLGVQTSVLFLTIVYVGENSPVESRRFYCSGIGISIRFGVVLTYLLGIWVSFRSLALTAIILEVIFVCLLVLNPISAVWLVQQGLENRAKEVLLYFHGREFDTDSEIAEMKRNNIVKLSVLQKLSQLSKWKVVKPIIIVTTLNNFKPLSGYPFLLAFSSEILSKQQGLPPNVAALFFPITVLVGNMLGQQLVSRFNIRRILISTTAILVLSHISMTIYFVSADHIFASSNNQYSSFHSTFSFWPILNIAIFGTCFGVGFDSVLYSLQGEAFDSNNRDLSVCILHTMGAVFSFLAIVAFQFVFTLLGGTLTFGILALILSTALPLQFCLIR